MYELDIVGAVVDVHVLPAIYVSLKMVIRKYAYVSSQQKINHSFINHIVLHCIGWGVINFY